MRPTLCWLGTVLGAVLFVLPAHAAPRVAPSPPQALEQLSAEYWQWNLSSDPVNATSLGDRRFDDHLSDITPAGRKRDRQQLTSLRHRADRVLPEGLSEGERVTRLMLLQAIDDDLARLDCDLVSWVVDPLGGPQVSFFDIPSQQPIRTKAEARAMVKRWQAMGPWVDALIGNLRRGLREKRVATRSQVESVLDELTALDSKPTDEWNLVLLAKDLPADWSDSEREKLRQELRSTVEKSLRPAFARYRTFLQDEVLPAARPQEKVGLVHLPGGLEAYGRLARLHTSLDLTPDRIHKIGLQEVDRIDKEMTALGQKVLGTADHAEILRRLREDPALHFATREEVAAKAQETLQRAQAATPQWFNIQPRAHCEVTRMEAHEEQHSTIAYYRQPAIDGSRPGRYYINTWAPETRPKYEAEALAFHEAVPGHHLQIAIAQELTGIPEFRKHIGCTAFVEGWGLYSERLANEMGLYSSDLDRLGMLSFDSWRACRLVVDTGMHALGWSRQQAIDYMTAHSALAGNNIVNEVDRYISWPGQALAYKLGQLEILRLRQRSKDRDPEHFDIKRFHDSVLRNGAVTLPVLQKVVEAGQSQ